MAESGGTTRERLVAAGIELLGDLPAERVLAGVPAASVAEAAGVTTGSFFHHFPTSADFVRAVALDFLEAHIRDDVEHAAQELIDSLAHQDLVGGVRAETNRTWEVLAHDDQLVARFRALVHLWAHHRAAFPPGGKGTPGGAGEPADIGEVIRRTYQARAAASREGWDRILERAGLAPSPPFTVERVSVALTALLDGLLLRRLVDPDAVDDDLYGDICAAVTATVHRPSDADRRRTAALAGVDPDGEHRSPQAQSGIRRRRSSRDRISRLAVGMFVDGWEEVSLSDVAERADVSPQTVLNLFGDVRGVAAMTFGRHLAHLRSELGAARTAAPEDPLAPLRAVLARLAEVAAGEPQVARALLEQRLVAAIRSGEALGEMDVRLEVPLAEVVGAALAGLDLDEESALDVATRLVNFVLVRGVAGTARPARVAEEAMCLLPACAGAPPLGPLGGLE